MYDCVSDSLVVLNTTYKIADVFRVTSSRNQSGKLLISGAPGKKDGRLVRNLVADLESMKRAKVDVIVCLLEWSELKMLGILDYPRKAQEAGFCFYHLQIRDLCAPKQKELDALIPLVIEKLAKGQNVLVHCRAGLGRAGTLSACCLVHLGFTATQAIESVRTHRPGAIQSSAQEEAVFMYYKRFKDLLKN